MNQHYWCAVCRQNNRKLWRIYGNFLRDEEIFCQEHRPADLINVLVPLIEDTDGSVWGYTSAPEEAIKRWEELP